MQSSPDICLSRRPLVIVFLALVLNTGLARAIIFYSTGDPNYNTTAPGGSLINSGWQYEGTWGGFLGTPIAPKYFITAEHIGGQIGGLFFFRGIAYPTTAVFDDTDSDLRIWRICGTFPDYAPIYTLTNEVGRNFVNIGRGTQRGAPVTTTNGLFGIKTNGWLWAAYDGVQRWGENGVAGIQNGNGILATGPIGEVLQATFDANAGANECHLSTGDSGGALFIKDGAVWKLAGINLAVDGPYNTSNSGPGFDAAIFDERGLYTTNSILGGWDQVLNIGPAQPGSLYSTRISAHVAWINSVINGAAQADPPPVLQSSASADRQYEDELNSMVDDVAKTITVALPGGSRFYRLRACEPFTIQSIQIQNGKLVLTYQ
jgi:hypothetical protein